MVLFADCVVSNAAENEATIFAIIDTQLYVPIVTLSTQYNANLLRQLILSFKRKINCNKYQSEVRIQAQNRYLNYLIDPSF